MKLKIQDGGYQFSASRKKKMVKKGTRFKMIVRAHTHTDNSNAYAKRKSVSHFSQFLEKFFTNNTISTLFPQARRETIIKNVFDHRYLYFLLIESVPHEFSVKRTLIKISKC